MGYCAREDVERAVGTAILIQLTDVDSAGAVNEPTLEDAITDASFWIDSFVEKVKKVPLFPVPERIKRLAVQEALYILKSNRPGMLDENDVKRHDERLVWLEKVSKGELALAIDPPATESPEVTPRVIERDESDAVSRGKMRGYA